jgi:hypothetical protein
MTHGARWVTFAAFAALVAPASFGCSALLDLDVQYVEAGTEGGVPGLDAGDDSSRMLEAAVPAMDGTVGLVDGNPGVDGSSLADGPGPVTDAPQTEASPGVPDAANDAPAGSIQFVQVLGQETTNNSPTQTIRMPGVQAHDAIILAIEYSTTANAQITDTAGSTYQFAKELPADAFGVESAIYYALDVAAGDDSITVALQVAGPVNTFEVFAQEYAGISALDAVDGQNSGTTSSGTNMESGFITTAVANELVFGFGVGGLVSPGVGFTGVLNFAGDQTEDLILAAPGMIEATEVNSGANTWSMMVAAFKPR